MSLHAIILGAGKGTRMKSQKVKLLHEAAGKLVINHVISNLEKVNTSNICMIVGYQAEEVKKAIYSQNLDFAEQKEQLGTGHAVMQAEDFFENKEGNIIIIAGDTPLISAGTLNDLYNFHKTNKSNVTVLSTIMPNPTGYGRIIRDNSEQVLKIVEQKDANDEEKAVQEINTGVYCVQKDVLFDSLNKVTANNKQKEYYLTDIIQIAKNNGLKVYSYIAKNHKEFQGINSRKDLADINSYLYKQKNSELMDEGVTIVDPNNTYIETDVTIGQDTIIYPGVYIKGTCKIGKNCIIGANSVISDSNIADDSTVKPNSNVSS